MTAQYDATYPMATLATGQEVTWQWPAKNHADVGVQRGVQVFISSAPDQTVDDFNPNFIAEMEFSKCNPRRPGVDGADCRDQWTVPTDLTPGVYTLMWWWEFNAGEFYNTCADVNIVAGQTGGGGADPAPSPTAPPAAAPTPPPVTPGEDYVGFSCPPIAVPMTGSFQITVDYQATSDQTVVLDIHSEDALASTWHGQGTMNTGATNGVQTSNITVTLDSALSAGGTSEYVLKAWMVDTTTWNAFQADNTLTPWDDATATGYTPVEAQATIVADTQCLGFGSGGSSGSSSSSSSSSDKTKDVLLAIFATLFAIGVLVAIVYCVIKSRNSVRMQRIKDRSRSVSRRDFMDDNEHGLTLDGSPAALTRHHNIEEPAESAVAL